MTQEKFQLIAQQIGIWSQANFGDQTSKRTGAVLGSLAPLLGMGEELNDELMTAVLKKDWVQTADAVADICVYLCDYAHRERMVLVYDPAKYLPAGSPRRAAFTDQLVSDLRFTVSPMERLLICYGRLLHVTLKSHQGIRGYDVFEKYALERTTAVDCFIDALQDFTLLHMESAVEEGVVDEPASLVDLLANVWDKVVSKRNWVTNPVDAHKEQIIVAADDAVTET